MRSPPGSSAGRSASVPASTTTTWPSGGVSGASAVRASVGTTPTGSCSSPTRPSNAFAATVSVDTRVVGRLRAAWAATAAATVVVPWPPRAPVKVIVGFIEGPLGRVVGEPGEGGVGVVGQTTGGFPDRNRRPALDEQDVLSTPGDPGAGRGRAPLRGVTAAARRAGEGAGRETAARRGRPQRGPPPGTAAVERACG